MYVSGVCTYLEGHSKAVITPSAAFPIVKGVLILQYSLSIIH